MCAGAAGLVSADGFVSRRTHAVRLGTGRVSDTRKNETGTRE